MPKDTWWNLPAAKRHRITRAARVEFGQRGFSAGSLNVIAREAGISKGSLFQYFDDKLDFFATVCRSAAADAAAAALDGVDRERAGYFDALRLMVSNWLRYFRQHPVERGMALAANGEIDSEARAAVRSVLNQAHAEVFGPMAARAAASGELRADVDPAQLVTMTVLLLRHLNTAPFFEHIDPVMQLTKKSAKEVHRIAQELVDALARAYSA